MFVAKISYLRTGGKYYYICWNFLNHFLYAIPLQFNVAIVLVQLKILKISVSRINMLNFIFIK